jgi:16S rRNA (guanine(966)-N(2))-methyltransferase RsmD
MLGDAVAGANVIDLFAGTGNLGIEALSRGAAQCWFCDISAGSVALLRKNLGALGIGAEGRVLQADFGRALREISAALKRSSDGESIDLIFVDPPYERGYYDKVMQILCARDMMSLGGLVVMEHAAETREGDKVFPGFCEIKSKKYGHTAVDVYERIQDERQENAVCRNV